MAKREDEIIFSIAINVGKDGFPVPESIGLVGYIPKNWHELPRDRFYALYVDPIFDQLRHEVIYGKTQSGIA